MSQKETIAKVMPENYRNFIRDNFENILSFASLSKFPKICDFCDELFEVDLHFQKYQLTVKCPICYSQYFAVRNELNDFYYLEFDKAHNEFEILEDYKFNKF